MSYSWYFLLHVHQHIFSFLFESFIIPSDSIFQLFSEFNNPLFLELQLLSLQSLISLKLNLPLSQVIKYLLVFVSQLFNLVLQFIFLSHQILSQILHSWFFTIKLNLQWFLLVLQCCYFPLLRSNIHSHLVQFGNEFFPFLIELVLLLLHCIWRHWS